MRVDPKQPRQLLCLRPLATYGITISNLTSGSSIVIENDPCCNPQTVMEETNPSLGVVSYTLNFMPPLSDLKFSRAAITLGTPVEPSWNATIYAGSTVVGSVGEGFLYLPAPSPSADFDFAAAGITSMVVTSNNAHFAAFTSAVLDNFIISRTCQVNPSDVTSYPGTPFSRDGKPLSMNAVFSPKDVNGMPLLLVAKAVACNFVNSHWQQEVVSWPLPNLFPQTPSAIDPSNLNSNGSLKAPPSFFDPPQGGYTFGNDSYPFYWPNIELLVYGLYDVGCTPCPPHRLKRLFPCASKTVPHPELRRSRTAQQ